MTVAFYIANDAHIPGSSKSMVKFGSMDSINLKRQNSIFVFRTLSTKTWNLRCKEFGLGFAGLTGEFQLVFEP
jgi:hypothetical protein